MNRTFTEDDMKWAILIRSAGGTLMEISSYLGFTHVTIHNRLKSVSRLHPKCSLGNIKRGHKRRRVFDHEEARELWGTTDAVTGETITLKYLSEKYNVRKSAVFQAIKRLDIEEHGHYAYTNDHVPED